MASHTVPSSPGLIIAEPYTYTYYSQRPHIHLLQPTATHTLTTANGHTYTYYSQRPHIHLLQPTATHTLTTANGHTYTYYSQRPHIHLLQPTATHTLTTANGHTYTYYSQRPHIHLLQPTATHTLTTANSHTSVLLYSHLSAYILCGLPLEVSWQRKHRIRTESPYRTHNTLLLVVFSPREVTGGLLEVWATG